MLLPSRIQRWVSGCCALLIGLTFAVVTDVFYPLNGAPGAGITVAVALMLIKFSVAAGALAPPMMLIFADTSAGTGADIRTMSGQLWIGSSVPPVDLVLPQLQSMRRYLGLIWLRNSAGTHTLIWPDSIGADAHRRVRVWLGIHARV